MLAARGIAGPHPPNGEVLYLALSLFVIYMVIGSLEQRSDGVEEFHFSTTLSLQPFGFTIHDDAQYKWLHPR